MGWRNMDPTCRRWTTRPRRRCLGARFTPEQNCSLWRPIRFAECSFRHVGVERQPLGRADARDERDAFLKFAREEASQRRDLAAERRDAYERHVAAIGQALKADRDPARVELLSAMLRKAQDEWVDHLRRTARFLDEGDPSLLDDPIYSRNLWDQLRRAT